MWLALVTGGVAVTPEAVVLTKRTPDWVALVVLTRVVFTDVEIVLEWVALVVLSTVVFTDVEDVLEWVALVVLATVVVKAVEDVLADLTLEWVALVVLLAVIVAVVTPETELTKRTPDWVALVTVAVLVVAVPVKICCSSCVLIVAAVTTPFPSVVSVTGLTTFNSCVHPRPGAGPNDAENLMARKVKRFVAWLAAGDVVPVNSC